LAGTLPPETLAALLGGSLNQNMMPSPPMPAQVSSSTQDALIAQLLNQLVFNNQQQQQQQHAAPMRMEAPRFGQSGIEQGALQAFLAQSGVMHSSAAGTSQQQMMPPSTSLMLSAQGTPAVFTHEHAGSHYGADFAHTLGSFGSSGGGSAPQSSGTASPSHSLTGVPSLGNQLGGSPGSPPHSSPPHSSPIFGGGFTSLSSAANPQLARRPASGESSPLGRYGAIGSQMGATSSPPGSVDENAAFGGSPVMSPNPWDRQ
jgi:hypothetical protein